MIEDLLWPVQKSNEKVIVRKKRVTVKNRDSQKLVNDFQYA